MEHDQVLELIPAYALGALEPLEARQVEAHLSECAGCQTELRSYQQVVAALPLAAPPRPPPAELKQRVLDRALRQPGHVPESRPSAKPGPTTWLARLSPAWGLVSLVLVIALVVSNLWLWQRVKRIESGERFSVVALAGTEITPEASGLMVIGSDGVEGTLVVEHLPVLEEAYQYQLWLIKDGQRTSGGVFSVNRFGYADVWILSETSLLEYDSFGVTVEPAGGSPGPTGDKVLGSGL